MEIDTLKQLQRQTIKISCAVSEDSDQSKQSVGTLGPSFPLAGSNLFWQMMTRRGDNPLGAFNILLVSTCYAHIRFKDIYIASYITRKFRFGHFLGTSLRLMAVIYCVI